MKKIFIVLLFLIFISGISFFSKKENNNSQDLYSVEEDYNYFNDYFQMNYDMNNLFFASTNSKCVRHKDLFWHFHFTKLGKNKYYIIAKDNFFNKFFEVEFENLKDKILINKMAKYENNKKIDYEIINNLFFDKSDLTTQFRYKLNDTETHLEYANSSIKTGKKGVSIVFKVINSDKKLVFILYFKKYKGVYGIEIRDLKINHFYKIKTVFPDKNIELLELIYKETGYTLDTIPPRLLKYYADKYGVVFYNDDGSKL